MKQSEYQSQVLPDAVSQPGRNGGIVVCDRIGPDSANAFLLCSEQLSERKTPIHANMMSANLARLFLCLTVIVSICAGVFINRGFCYTFATVKEPRDNGC